MTRRQQEIYDYLRENAEYFDHPPTFDELCLALGLSSRGSLHKHIQALVESGLVEPMDGKHRGIRLRPEEPEEEEEGTPFLGTIAAGRPIEAVPQPEYLPVPEFLLTDHYHCYVLKIKGESMVDAGIMDGDLVVIEKRETARDGEIVVALVNNEEATLKRLRDNRDGTVTLIPENAAMESMVYPAEQVAIQGVLVSLMRRY